MSSHINAKIIKLSQLNDSESPKPLKIASPISEQSEPVPAATSVSWAAKTARKRILKLLSELQHGCITIQDPLGSVTCGDPTAGMRCDLKIYHLNAYSTIAFGGSNGSAQAYINGLWVADDLTTLIRIFVRNRSLLESVESGLTKVAQLLYRASHALNRNTRKGSRRNIAAHYDLGNDFFRLFLDSQMMYSSALYQSQDSLESASQRKLQRICDVLELGADDHLVEIGSGWGGLACFAARTTGCKVTTVTISQEQYAEAVERVKRQGLTDLVTVKLQDYRDIEGEFDKLVSIEMIEAVGHQYLDTYFNKIKRLLKHGGKALIQSIVIDDQRYQAALKQVDFIKKYIFPGGFLPSYSEMTRHAGNNALMLEDMYDMGLSYAQTLRDWRRRFYAEIGNLESLGYDKAFQRMWDFYLCYCEGAFDERATSVGQLVFRKQGEMTKTV